MNLTQHANTLEYELRAIQMPGLLRSLVLHIKDFYTDGRGPTCSKDWSKRPILEGSFVVL